MGGGRVGRETVKKCVWTYSMCFDNYKQHHFKGSVYPNYQNKVVAVSKQTNIFGVLSCLVFEISTSEIFATSPKQTAWVKMYLCCCSQYWKLNLTMFLFLRMIHILCRRNWTWLNTKNMYSIFVIWVNWLFKCSGIYYRILKDPLQMF